MSRALARLLGVGTVALLLGGCQTTASNVKPKLVEEYNLPPTDDPRFSAPVAFPKETLNTPPARGANPNGPGGPGGPAFGRGGRPGMGGGAGGMGGY